jgi:hypothetical protein
MAAGGAVAAGVPYLVGEFGPELFMPNLGGTIVNDARIQAAMTGIVGSDYVNQVVRQTVGQAALSMAAMHAEVVAAVGSAGAAGGAGGANAQLMLMQQMAAARRWTGAHWNAQYALEMREAGFNQFARNASSGAYGAGPSSPRIEISVRWDSRRRFRSCHADRLDVVLRSGALRRPYRRLGP